MTGAAEARKKIAEANVDVDRFDVGARHHDVVDADVAQAKNIGEHRPFFRREAGSDVLRGKGVGEFLADRASTPETDGGAQPIDPGLFRDACRARSLRTRRLPVAIAHSAPPP